MSSSSYGAHPTRRWHRIVGTGLQWKSSGHDEHRGLLVAAGVAAAFGLALGSLPRRLDVVHAFMHGRGVMAPTCGLTRAGLELVSGDIGSAWSYNPSIFVVAPLTAMLMARFAAGTLAGRWVTVRVGTGIAARTGVVVLVFALWLNQQANFDFLAR